MSGMPTFLLVLVAGCCGCSQHKTVEIADVTKPSVVTLTALPDGTGNRIVVGITLRFRGHIDGSAMIGATNVWRQTLSGDFDLMTGGDWRSTNCALQYIPENVRSGRVAIEYDFRTYRIELVP